MRHLPRVPGPVRSPPARRVPPPLPTPPESAAPDPATDETAWVTAAQAGDRAAFARLVDAYWDRLYRWLVQLTRDRHRAEDLTQETFLKVLANLQSFRPGSNFRAWLFRIAHNNFVNTKRADRKTTQVLADDPADPTAADPEATAADRESLQAVAAAVAGLAPEFRSALLLRADEGLSFKEVAAVLHITEETARWRVFKARQRLVAALSSDVLPPGLGSGGE